MGISALLVDVDGTLVDNTAQHIDAWRTALDKLGVAADPETLRRNIGKGGDLFVKAVAGEAWDREHGDRCRDVHAREYQARLASVKGVPFARAFLEQAQQLGLSIVLATSSNPEEVERNLAVIDERPDDFPVVDKDAGTSKPAPDVLAVALDRSRAAAADAVAIGDTRWDGEAASRVGVRFWGVLTGAGRADELRDAVAARVFPNLRSVLEAVRAERTLSG